MRSPKAGLTLLPLLRLHPLHPHSPLKLCRPRPTAVVGLSIVFQDIRGRLDLPAPGLQFHAPGPLAQGQLLQAGDRKPRCFIESRSKVSKKEKGSRRSSRDWSLARLVPGLREGGNDAAWAQQVSGAPFAGNLQAAAARRTVGLWEGQLSLSRLTHGGSVHGAVCAQHPVLLESESRPQPHPCTHIHRRRKACHAM